jgi:hypothetical protein
MAEPKRLVDIQLEILNAELDHIGGAIRQHDEIAKSVKNWAVVTWTASVGLALSKQDLHGFLWMTAIVPLVFWIVDGSFRRIQRTFIGRIREISEYVNSAAFRTAAEKEAPLEFPLLLMRRKTASFKDTLLGAMLFRSVSLFYVGLAVSSFLVWLTLKRVQGG